MEIIIKKIEKILLEKFPNEKEREETVGKCGEIVLLETTEEVLQGLGDDEKRTTFSDYINSGNITEAMMFAEDNGIKMEDIFEKKSIEVTKMVLEM